MLKFKNTGLEMRKLKGITQSCDRRNPQVLGEPRGARPNVMQSWTTSKRVGCLR